MTNRQREAIELRLEGLTMQEIADKMGCTRSNVQILLKTALKMETVKHGRITCKYPAIAEYIDCNGLTYTRFAKMVGISYSAMNKLFKGEFSPRKETIDSILAVTGLTYEEAFRED